MDIYELAKRLEAMWREGEPLKRKTAMIHLFGIKYSCELEGLNIGKLCLLAGLKSSETTEVRAGMNLAEYVIAKTHPGS